MHHSEFSHYIIKPYGNMKMNIIVKLVVVSVIVKREDPEMRIHLVKIIA